MTAYSREKDAKPLYEQIQDDLIHQIETGTLADHQRVPSENELSRMYNVSRITATKALTELALNGYIYRLQGRGSFVTAMQDRPVQAARTGEGVKPYLVGLLLPCVEDSHVIKLIRGINHALPFPQFLVHVFNSTSTQMEEYILRHIYQNRNHYDGVLLFPNDFEFYSDTILQMHLEKYPFVLLDRIFQNLNCPYVTCENQTGSEIAVSYFVRKGHTKIGYTSPISFQEQVTGFRYGGYLTAMNKHDLPPRSYENLFGDLSQPSQARLLEDITSGRLTALLTSNIGCAVSLLELLRKHDIRVPEDVSVICFDSPSPYESSLDFFTYIDQDSYNMGMTAGGILRCLITKEGNVQTLHQVMRPVLVENHSVRAI